MNSSTTSQPPTCHGHPHRPHGHAAAAAATATAAHAARHGEAGARHHGSGLHLKGAAAKKGKVSGYHHGEGYIHWIGLRENFNRKAPYFMGKSIWFPVDFPLNQSID